MRYLIIFLIASILSVQPRVAEAEELDCTMAFQELQEPQISKDDNAKDFFAEYIEGCREHAIYPFYAAQYFEKTLNDINGAYAYLLSAWKFYKANLKTDQKVSISSILYELGRLELALRKYDMAQEHLTATEKLNPNALNLQYMLALVYTGLDQPKRAERYFESCLEQKNNKKFRVYCFQNIYRANVFFDDVKYKALKKDAEEIAQDVTISNFEHEIFTPEFGRLYTHDIGICANVTSEEELKPTQFVISLRQIGGVEKVTFSEETKFTKCFGKKLSNAVFSPPPIHPYHIDMNLSFSP